jgi:tripartite-type tricarboxylate transporter receptor subunit TctC
MHRRNLLQRPCLAAACAAALLAGLPSARAQDAAAAYPNQMVRMVVPFSAGSMTDVLARSISEKLGPKWGQQVIVENRPGIPGTASVANGPADGLTLMLTSNGHTVLGAINKNLTFDPVKNFTAVTQVASMPAILVVPADSAVKSLADLIEAAKAKPGGLNYSSAGIGSATNIAFEVLLQTAGIQMTHVPYKGMPESQSSVIRGDAAAGFTFFSVGGELIKAGKMRAVAVTGKTRLQQLPDVPTFAEAGLTGFDYDAWFGIMVPAATPKPIADKVAKDVAEVLASPDLSARFAAQGVNVVSSTPETFGSLVRTDTERFGKLYTKTGG